MLKNVDTFCRCVLTLDLWDKSLKSPIYSTISFNSGNIFHQEKQMSFDKVKAMRNAERFLAQGKLRAAISEYKRVIEFDKTDFNTLNMLGDLYAKASDPDEAVNCFTQVAEHYGKQGFAQKAIAIYNKISRLKPESIEVSAKLAQLYQMKGSVAEARTHYTTVAEQYSKTGKKAEALNIWKQIANLDPNNTDIYLKIADACWQDQQKEEAANAYIEAGNRLSKKQQFESAITAFSRALEIRPDDLPALRGYVKSQIGLGYADEAAKSLESSLIRQPHSREIIDLLADCYIEAGSIIDAERTVVKLVEKEPTHYPKLLEIFDSYLKQKDLSSAARILTMVSEHMLVGGKAIELEQKINQILDIDPDDLDTIRLLVRFNNWQRDEAGIKNSLERLAEAARVNNSIEDEKYALSQLVLLAPQNIYFAQRLQEVNIANGNLNGFYENPSQKDSSETDVPTFESFRILGQEDESAYAEYEGGFEIVNENGNGHHKNLEDFEKEESANFYTSGSDSDSFADSNFQSHQTVRELTEFEKHGLQTEIEGINFYIEQGFYDLAEKTLAEIENRFGNQPEILELWQIIESKNNSQTAEDNTQVGEVAETAELKEEFAENENVETSEFETLKDESFESGAEGIPAQEVSENESEFSEEISEVDNEEVESHDDEVEEEVENVETNHFVSDEETNEELFQETQFEEINSEINQPDEPENEMVSEQPIEQMDENNFIPNQFVQVNPLEDLRSELSSMNALNENLMDQHNSNDEDFETSYQTGIVYREMGLIEDSIHQFQDAIKLVTSQDGTRRFFLCCNMLGLCFMEKEMPTIAIMWFKQGLESNHLAEFEMNGMRYELANAFEKAGDKPKARQIFEEIYAVDVSFRDVGKRLQNLIGV